MTLPILALVYSTGQEINSIQDRQDRNCRVLSIIQADVRYIIVEGASSKDEARAFRELFRHGVMEACKGG